jgi:DNA-binding transcriptional MerR regulator
MPQAKLTISEIGDLLGIAPKTIRHYHDVGVLPEPERGENGYRLYTGADLRRIQRIRELQAFGLSLRQIKYILEADEPDTHLRAFLTQRDRDLADEIHRLQQQQARVRAFLNGDLPDADSRTPSQQILREIIRPASSSLADVLVEVEARPLAELDRLPHDERYTLFWEQVATRFVQSIQPHEHDFILWLERYLALAEMKQDDRQAQAWLRELYGSASVPVLRRAFELPASDLLPVDEQFQLRHLLQLLLYEQATPLQQLFLASIR